MISRERFNAYDLLTFMLENASRPYNFWKLSLCDKLFFLR